MAPDRSLLIRSTLPTATALVEQLIAAMAQTRSHEFSHPRVATPLAAAQGCLLRLGRDLDDQQIDLQLQGERLSLSGLCELPDGPGAVRMAHALRAQGLGGLRLGVDAGSADFAMLFRILTAPVDGEKLGTARLNVELARGGAGQIELLPPPRETSNSPQTGERPRPIDRRSTAKAPPTREPGLVTATRAAFAGVIAGRGLELGGMRQELRTALDKLLERGVPLTDLSRRRHDDPDGSWHAVRTCALALQAAKALTDDQETLMRLGVATLLHDVGEQLLPESARHDAAVIDSNISGMWQRHAEIGAEYLLGHPGMDPLCVTVALSHHRNHVGGGHPYMFHDHALSSFTDLVRIADVFEVLTAPAPHREPLQPTHAFRLMTDAKGELSPAMLRCFIETLGFHPCGQVVKLTSGEVARVVRQGRRIDAPVVTVVGSAEGQPLPKESRHNVDLSHPSPGAPRLATVM